VSITVVSRWCRRCCCCICTKPVCCYCRKSSSPCPDRRILLSPSSGVCRALTLRRFVGFGHRHCAPQSGSCRRQFFHQWHPSFGAAADGVVAATIVGSAQQLQQSLGTRTQQVADIRCSNPDPLVKYG